MISESLAHRYALALFNLAGKQEILDSVQEEFNLFDELLTMQEKFRYFIISPKIVAREKKQILKSVFDGKITPALLNFIFLLLDKKRQTLISKIKEHFDTLCDNFHNKTNITVHPAIKLDDDVLEQIKNVYEEILNKSVTIQEEVDPSIIGGFQVRVGNTIYDASIAQSLNNMRRSLML